MSFISRISSTIGLVLLAHAYDLHSSCFKNIADLPSGYSAYEHSALQTQLLQSNTSTAAGLPLDITVETIIAVLLVSVGIVLGAQPLQPISWRVWAGNIEKEGGSKNPFRSLEERPGFLDIRVSDRVLRSLSATADYLPGKAQGIR